MVTSVRYRSGSCGTVKKMLLKMLPTSTVVHSSIISATAWLGCSKAASIAVLIAPALFPDKDDFVVSLFDESRHYRREDACFVPRHEPGPQRARLRSFPCGLLCEQNLIWSSTHGERRVMVEIGVAAMAGQTRGPVRDTIKTVTEDPAIFVYGISDQAVSGIDLQTPNGNVQPVAPRP